MLFARNAQANFTAEAQRTQRREELYVFVLLAFSGCQYKGEQPLKASRTRPKRKQSNPSPTARATIYMRDAFSARIAIIGRIPFAKRNGLLLRPSLMVGLERYILELLPLICGELYSLIDKPLKALMMAADGQ